MFLCITVILLLHPRLKWEHFILLYQVKGLSNLLKTSTEKGILGDETDLLKRRNAFGSNTYPRKKGRSFLVQISSHLFLLFFCCCCRRRRLVVVTFSLFYVWQRFLWEAWQDLTLIILIIAAVASLALGIKTEVCSVY